MRTDLIFILDRSGSMESIRSEVIGGFNNILATQRGNSDPCSVTVCQFDDKYEIVYEARPLASCPDLTVDTFVPRGMTALLDAIGRTVVGQGKRFAALADTAKPEKVILVIVTDGEENASHEWTKARVKALLEEQQTKWNWTVTFLGANQDAITEAGQIGIRASMAIDFSANDVGVAAVADSVGSLIGASRTGGSYAYTSADRAAAVNDAQGMWTPQRKGKLPLPD